MAEGKSESESQSTRENGAHMEDGGVGKEEEGD